MIRITNTDMRKCAQVSMGILNSLQDAAHDTQVMATAVLFLCLCERYDLIPSNILNFADMMVKKSGGYSKASFEAVKAYMKNELED